MSMDLLSSPPDRRTSVSMMQEFRKKFERTSRYTDDALELERRDSNVIDLLIEAVMLIGVYPWEGSGAPRVLFQYPEGSVGEEIPPFCFPSGCKSTLQVFQDQDGIPKHILTDENISGARFVPLYFPEFQSAPYMFCYYFEVSPLTFPSFGHDLGLKDLLGKLGEKYTPLSTVCLAVKTKFPSAALFKGWMEWILLCELVQRGHIEQVFRKHMAGDTEVADASDWPQTARQKMMDVFQRMHTQPPPAPRDSLEISIPPLPCFTWLRPECEGAVHGPLARECLSYLISRIDMQKFICLYYSVLLEKTVILYHKDATVLGYCVLCLHFLCYPLKWKMPSVSILPDQLRDIIDAPNPIFIGTLHPLKSSLQSNTVYIDLVEGTVETSEDLPECPRGEALKEVLAKIWTAERPAMAILAAVNSVTKGFFDQIDPSTMTNYTNPEDVKSVFMQQLFEGRFLPKEREYIKAMLKTQMFRYAIEQRCRMKSNSMMIECMKAKSLESVAQQKALSEQNEPGEKEAFPSLS